MVTYLEAQRSLNSHSVVQSIFSNITYTDLRHTHLYTHNAIIQCVISHFLRLFNSFCLSLCNFNRLFAILNLKFLTVNKVKSCHLPSRLMPTAMHFFRRQYWQRLRLIRRILHC